MPVLRNGKIKVYNFFLVAVFVCMTNIFGFYVYMPLGERLYSNDYRYILVFALSAFVILCAALHNGKISLSGRFMHMYILLLALVVIEVVWTYSQYHQPIILTLKEAFYYVVPFAAYIAYLQFKDRITFDNIADTIVRIAIAASIVAIIAFFLYTFAGWNILRLSGQNYRYGTIRFSVGELVVRISLIISCTRLILHIHKKIDIINIIVSFFHVIFIAKTRTALLYLIATILFAFLFGKKTSPLKKAVIVLGIIICMIGVLFSFDTVMSIAQEYISNDSGIMIRFQTISFYMNQFLDHPILGMGLLSAKRGIPGSELMFGEAGYYYRSDVGVIGLLVTFGIFGLLWVIAFLADVTRRLRRCDKVRREIIRNIVFYLAITMINLSFMDAARVMYVFMLTILTESLIRERHDTSAKKNLQVVKL